MCEKGDPPLVQRGIGHSLNYLKPGALLTDIYIKITYGCFPNLI